MADRPDTYLNSPAKPFLQQIKAIRDEITLIEGYPGEYICLARRDENDWFLTGINAPKERMLSVPLDFLKQGEYQIEMFIDHPKQPMTNIKVLNESVTSK